MFNRARGQGTPLAAIGLDEEYVWPWLGKAKLYLKQNKQKKALQYLERALELDPDFTEARELNDKISS